MSKDGQDCYDFSYVNAYDFVGIGHQCGVRLVLTEFPVEDTKLIPS